MYIQYIQTYIHTYVHTYIHTVHTYVHTVHTDKHMYIHTYKISRSTQITAYRFLLVSSKALMFSLLLLISMWCSSAAVSIRVSLLDSRVPKQPSGTNKLAFGSWIVQQLTILQNIFVFLANLFCSVLYLWVNHPALFSFLESYTLYSQSLPPGPTKIHMYILLSCRHDVVGSRYIYISSWDVVMETQNTHIHTHRHVHSQYVNRLGRTS